MKKLISESSSAPNHIDSSSSSTTIYINENIREETRTLPALLEGEEPQEYTIFVYDQYVFSREEFPMYLEDKELTSEQKSAKIAELEAYLESTDWYAIRYAETDVKVPRAVRENRQKARVEISLLRDLITYLEEGQN